MRLYLVKADESDYDMFDSAVVYAKDEADAVEIVREECAKLRTSAPGVWYPIEHGATLAATPIERKRGPVHGYGRAG